MSNSKELRSINLSELKQMNGKNGMPLWILIEDFIYDITGYDHPGGLEVFDQDNDNYSDLYEKFMDFGHSPSAERLMKTFLIGKLEK